MTSLTSPSNSARPFRPMTSLDAVDRQLMAALSENARLPNNALAEVAGVAPSTCSLRLKRLLEIGAIRGFHADLAPEAMGRPIQAMIAVHVQPEARSDIERTTERLARLPGVLNVYFLSGRVDFLIQVAVESPDELRRFVTQHLSASREFTFTETSLVFSHVRGGR